MKVYKSITSFCLLLACIKRGSALYTPLDEKAKCVNGKLVQYANYYACECVAGNVHTTDLNCSPKIEGACSKLNEICGDYAKCVVASGIPPSETFKCECLEGYEYNKASPPVCVPKGCKDIGDKCANGLCAKKDDTTSICSCYLGYKLEIGTGKCIKNDTPDECKLTCTGDHVTCVSDSKIFSCGCEDGYELKEGKCVEKTKPDEFTPLNEKSLCENGRLVQYSNYYACICEGNKVHSTELKCVDPVKDGVCKAEKEICADFATCKKGVAKDDTIKCVCNEGYESNGATPMKCVPVGCKDLGDKCEKNECVKKDNKTAMCGCPLGKKHDDASGKCIESTDPLKCLLNCSLEHSFCSNEDVTHFKCDCTEGYEFKEGKCVKVSKPDIFVKPDETSTCEKGKLVQFTNFFSCVCDGSKVHKNVLSCEDSTKGKCTKENAVCGEYATCQKTTDEKKNETLSCTCIENYEFKVGTSTPTCVPIGCNDIADTCEKNICIKTDDKNVECGCPIGKILDGTTGKCVVNSKKEECKLKCEGENRDCVIGESKYYTCGCKDGFELKDGKCVAKGDKNSAFHGSGIFNVGLLFLATSVVYVLL